MTLLNIKPNRFEVEGQEFCLLPTLYDTDRDGVLMRFPDGTSVMAPLDQFQSISVLKKWINTQIEYWFKGV